jgi:N-acetylmuramoyl-L-alanine amidase
MKKGFLPVFALACTLFSTPAYAAVTTNYLEDNFETTQEHYSIAGASDPKYPLTLNGEVVETTESGYFCYYADLQEGENVFVLDNVSDQKVITITRKSSDSGSASGSDEFTAMNAVGVVNRNHPTVRSRPDEEYDDLIGPYVKDTYLHIIGKNSEYYKTAHGAYLYFDSVNLIDNQNYTANSVASVIADGDAVEIQMDRATEYKCDLTDDGLELTLYDTDASNGKITVSGDIVNAIEKEKDVHATYRIKFNEEHTIVGYMCYYEGGKLWIEFNEGTVVKDHSLNGVKIVLDAGHGGEQTGASGLGPSPEKDITLSITRYLGTYLSSRGAAIVYTRTDDSTLELAPRSAQIIAEKPDISVSIHCNSMNPWMNYNEYIGTLNLYTHDSPTQFVEKLTEELKGSTYRKQNLALTRTSICPAVLIETGFISNPVECEYLSKDKNQKEMAEKIGYAIEQYFYGLEKAQ